MATPAKRSRSGLLTVLAVFLFGGVFVGGLYFTAWRDTPAEYRASTPGVPARTLRFASCDLKWQAENLELIVAELRRLRPDYILLQRTLRKTAQELAVVLEMRDAGELQMYSSPGESDNLAGFNNAILTRHRLYKGRAMPKDEATDFGIWVESIVEGKRFLLGCVDVSSGEQKRSGLVIASWKKAGSVPMVLGGRSSPQAASHLTAYLAGSFSGSSSTTEHIFVTEHWRAAGPRSAATQPASSVTYIDLEPAK